MKIIHFSDTHLGLGLENTTREDDFYVNFASVFDTILSLKPDLVIHSGDLFHTSKPSNKAISVAIKHFMQLKNAGIKVVLIAGNHDTPRLSITTHPFEIFHEFDNMYLAYLPQLHIFSIAGAHIVALPHAHEQAVFDEAFQQALSARKEGVLNIFVGHFGLQAKEYDEYTDEISGVNIKMEDLQMLKAYDYVALGHYHKHFFMGNISYCGSIEHTSFNQRNATIGINLITFEKGEIKKEHLPLPARPMIDLGDFASTGIQTMEELILSLKNFLEGKIIPGAIVRLIVSDFSQELLMDFQDRKLRELFDWAFHFEYKKLKAREAGHETQNVLTTSENLIKDNFENFFSTYPLSPTLPKETIKSKLQEILSSLTS